MFPDGRRVVSGAKDFGNMLKVWDVETGKCVLTMRGHELVRYAVSTFCSIFVICGFAVVCI